MTAIVFFQDASTWKGNFERNPVNSNESKLDCVIQVFFSDYADLTQPDCVPQRPRQNINSQSLNWNNSKISKKCKSSYQRQGTRVLSNIRVLVTQICFCQSVFKDLCLKILKSSYKISFFQLNWALMRFIDIV